MRLFLEYILKKLVSDDSQPVHTTTEIHFSPSNIFILAIREDMFPILAMWPLPLKLNLDYIAKM